MSILAGLLHEVTQLEKLLTCTLCTNLIDNPYAFACEHVFCKACIDKKLEGNGFRESKCPTCEKPSWQRDLHPNRLLSRILQDHLPHLRALAKAEPTQILQAPDNAMGSHGQPTHKPQSSCRSAPIGLVLGKQHQRSDSRQSDQQQQRQKQHTTQSDSVHGPLAREPFQGSTGASTVPAALQPPPKPAQQQEQVLVQSDSGGAGMAKLGNLAGGAGSDLKSSMAKQQALGLEPLQPAAAAGPTWLHMSAGIQAWLDHEDQNNVAWVHPPSDEQQEGAIAHILALLTQQDLGVAEMQAELQDMWAVHADLDVLINHCAGNDTVTAQPAVPAQQQPGSTSAISLCAPSAYVINNQPDGTCAKHSGPCRIHSGFHAVSNAVPSGQPQLPPSSLLEPAQRGGSWSTAPRHGNLMAGVGTDSGVHASADRAPEGAQAAAVLQAPTQPETRHITQSVVFAKTAAAAAATTADAVMQSAPQPVPMLTEQEAKQEMPQVPSAGEGPEQRKLVWQAPAQAPHMEAKSGSAEPHDCQPASAKSSSPLPARNRRPVKRRKTSVPPAPITNTSARKLPQGRKRAASTPLQDSPGRAQPPLTTPHILFEHEPLPALFNAKEMVAVTAMPSNAAGRASTPPVSPRPGAVKPSGIFANVVAAELKQLGLPVIQLKRRNPTAAGGVAASVGKVAPAAVPVTLATLLDTEQAQPAGPTQIRLSLVTGDEDTRARLTSYIKGSMGAVIQDKVSWDTTHVVVQCDSQGVAVRRTVRLLEGMMHGCHVVRHDWAVASVMAKRWLEEEQYLVQGDPYTERSAKALGWPELCELSGAERVRLRKLAGLGSNLFDGVSFFIATTAFDDKGKAQSLSMVMGLGGAKQLQRPPQRSLLLATTALPLHVPSAEGSGGAQVAAGASGGKPGCMFGLGISPPPMIVFVGEGAKTKDCQALKDRWGVWPTRDTWAKDCVTHFVLLPLETYQVK